MAESRDKAKARRKATLDQIAQLNRLADLAAQDGTVGLPTLKDALNRILPLAEQIGEQGVVGSVTARLAALEDAPSVVVGRGSSPQNFSSSSSSNSTPNRPSYNAPATIPPLPRTSLTTGSTFSPAVGSTILTPATTATTAVFRPSSLSSTSTSTTVSPNSTLANIYSTPNRTSVTNETFKNPEHNNNSSNSINNNNKVKGSILFAGNTTSIGNSHGSSSSDNKKSWLCGGSSNTESVGGSGSAKKTSWLIADAAGGGGTSSIFSPPPLPSPILLTPNNNTTTTEVVDSGGSSIKSSSWLNGEDEPDIVATNKRGSVSYSTSKIGKTSSGKLGSPVALSNNEKSSSNGSSSVTGSWSVHVDDSGVGGSSSSSRGSSSEDLGSESVRRTSRSSCETLGSSSMSEQPRRSFIFPGSQNSETRTSPFKKDACESCLSPLTSNSVNCHMCKRFFCSACCEPFNPASSSSASSSLNSKAPLTCMKCRTSRVSEQTPYTSHFSIVHTPITLKSFDPSFYQSKMVTDCVERIKTSESAIRMYEKQILERAKKESEPSLTEATKKKLEHDRAIRRMQKDSQGDRSTLDVLQEKFRQAQHKENTLFLERFFPPELKWQYQTPAGENIFVGVRDMTMENLDVKFKMFIKNQKLTLQLDVLTIKLQLYHMRIKAGSTSKQMLIGMFTPEHLGLELKNENSIILPLAWHAQEQKWKVNEDESKFKLNIVKTVQGGGGNNNNNNETAAPQKLLNWLINTFLPKFIKTTLEKYMLTEFATLFCDQANEATFQGECIITNVVPNDVFVSNLSNSSSTSEKARVLVNIDNERAQILNELITNSMFVDLRSVSLDTLTRYHLLYGWCDKLWPQLQNDWNILSAVCLKARSNSGSGEGFMRHIFTSVDLLAQKKECVVSLSIPKLDLNVALLPALTIFEKLAHKYLDLKKQRQEEMLQRPKKPGEKKIVVWSNEDFLLRKNKIKKAQKYLNAKYKFLSKHLHMLTLVCSACLNGGKEANTEFEVSNLTVSGVIPRWHKDQLLGKLQTPQQQQEQQLQQQKRRKNRPIVNMKTEYTPEGHMVVEMSLDGHKWDPVTREVNPTQAHAFVYRGTIKEIVTNMHPTPSSSFSSVRSSKNNNNNAIFSPHGVLAITSLRMQGPLEPIVRIGSLMSNSKKNVTKHVRWKRVSEMQAFFLPFLLIDSHAFHLALGVALRLNNLPSEIEGTKELFLQVGTDSSIAKSDNNGSESNSNSGNNTDTAIKRTGWHFSMRIDILEFAAAFWGDGKSLEQKSSSSMNQEAEEEAQQEEEDGGEEEEEEEVVEEGKENGLRRSALQDNDNEDAHLLRFSSPNRTNGSSGKGKGRRGGALGVSSFVSSSTAASVAASTPITQELEFVTTLLSSCSSSSTSRFLPHEKDTNFISASPNMISSCALSSSSSASSLAPIPCFVVCASFLSQGVRCIGTLTVPVSESARLTPLVVLGHGMGCWAEFEPLPTLRRACVSQGFSVFTFDYRSFGLSDGQPRAEMRDINNQVEDWINCILAISNKQLQQIGSYEKEDVLPVAVTSELGMKLVSERTPGQPNNNQSTLTTVISSLLSSDQHVLSDPDGKEVEPLLSDSSLSHRIDRSHIALCGVGLGGGHVIKAAADSRIVNLDVVKGVVSIQGCMDFNVVNGRVGDEPGFCSKMASALCCCCMPSTPLVPQSPGDEFASTLHEVIKKSGKLSASGNGDGIKSWKDGKITDRQLKSWRASYRPLDNVKSLKCPICFIGARQDLVSPYPLILEAWQRRRAIDELWVMEGTHSVCYEGPLMNECALRQAAFLRRQLT